MPRFLSYLLVGTAAAFLVVATASFSPESVKWLAFGIGGGTAVVASATALSYRRHVGTLVVTVTTGLIGAWTVVSSLVFSVSTVDNLALASALAIAGLSIIGITTHELSSESAVALAEQELGEIGGHLSAAA